MKSNIIDRVVVSKQNPNNDNVLWIDTSDGEKNASLKYKGNVIVGGNSNNSTNNTAQQGQNTIDSNYGVLSMYIPDAGTYSKLEFETRSGITFQDLKDAACGLYRWVRKLPEPVGTVPITPDPSNPLTPQPGYTPSQGYSSYDMPIISSPNYNAYSFTIGAIDYNGIWEISYHGGEEYEVIFIAFGS